MTASMTGTPGVAGDAGPRGRTFTMSTKPTASRGTRVVRCAFTMCTLLLVTMQTSAESWPQWRGTARNGTTSESSGYDGSSWNPTEIWELNNWGKGGTSPILVNGKIYVMGWSGGKDYVYCVNASNGSTVWSSNYNCPEYGRKQWGRNQQYIGGPLATPALDVANNRLYTYSCDGDLRCYNSTNGSLVWSTNLYNTYNMLISTAGENYGTQSAPLISGSWVVVEVGKGTNSASMMAFNKTNGSLAWKSASNEIHGRSSSPVQMSVGGQTCFAAFTDAGVVVTRADTHATVGKFAFQARYGHNIPTPVVMGSKLLVTAGMSSKTFQLNVSLSGGVTKDWETSNAFSKVVSPVVSGGYAYTINAGRLQCLNLSSRARAWQSSSANFGNDDEGSLVLTGDNKLIAWGENNLVLVEATNSSFQELARRSGVLGSSDYDYPHVLLAEGYILCKTKNGRMACLTVPTSSPVAPTITGPASLADGEVSSSFSATFAATGTAPITWDKSAGTLPPGMSISSSGSYSGTPTTAGSYTFTVRAQNAAGNDTKVYTHVIDPEPVTPPSITGPASLGDGTVNSSFSATFTAGGDTPITWSTSAGTLPPGMSIASNGTYSGTPTAAGSYTFTVQAQNAGGSDTKQYTHTIDPEPVPPTITAPASLADGQVGTSFSATFTASGDTPITWSKSAGTLPPGMSISSSGSYSGTPTAAGSYTFTVRAQNGAGTDTKQYTHVIDPEPPTITGPATLNDGLVGSAYSATFAASGTTPITWDTSAGTLPPGMSIASNGTYSGTPTTAGSYTFTVRAQNGGGSDTQQYTHTIVAAAVAPSITAPASLADGKVNASFSASFTASGTAPITWSTSAGTLPPGMSIAANGTYSGTPTTAGSYTFTVKAENTAGNDTQQYTHVIDPEPAVAPSITGPASLTDGTVGDPYSATFTASGDTPITWDTSAGTLPPGMSIASNGAYSGTPTTAGSYTFTVRAQNAGGTDTQQYTHTIGAVAPPLPSPWVNADIGAVSAAGSATYSSGTFTVNGSGADIYGSADEFHFVYQSFSGNGSIVARVESQTGTNSWSKCGVMMRDTLDANSAHAMMEITTGNGSVFGSRSSTGGSTTDVKANDGATAPKWVKVERTDSAFIGSVSDDGATWVEVGSVAISMGADISIGMAVTNHSDGSISTATFDSVSITAGSTPTAPTITSAAPTMVTAGQLYTYTIVATGDPAPTLSVSGEPAWLTLSGDVLSGTPQAGDVGTTAAITITASNGASPDATEQFTITVVDAAAAPVVTIAAPDAWAWEGGDAATIVVTRTGDAGAAISAALAAGRICDLFLLVRSVLMHYNPHSPFVSLDNWHGIACHECGYITSGDDVFWCAACEHDFCGDCSSYCRRCDESTCINCLENCPACDEPVCPSCMTRCPDCEEPICKTCLEEQQCPCIEENEENQDEQAENMSATVTAASG